MRLSDLTDLVGSHGAAQYAVKKAGYMWPISVGLQTPGIADRAATRYRDTKRTLDSATGQQLDSSVAEKRGTIMPPAGGFNWQEAMRSASGPAKTTMKGKFQEGLVSGAGKAVATVGIALLADLASKAKAAIGSIGANAARDAILKQLKNEDSVLTGADDKVLMEAYHTMVRFAPTLSTDKNAVRSFLRQAVMSGAGPDYSSIKLLADTERAVTSPGKDR